MAASVITLIFLGFGLMGWISGAIILIFAILYIVYVGFSYFLARNNDSTHPLATIDLDNCKDTIDNLDLHNSHLLSNAKITAGKKKESRLNLISVERNSLTPQIETDRKWVFVLILNNIS